MAMPKNVDFSTKKKNNKIFSLFKIILFTIFRVVHAHHRSPAAVVMTINKAF
jgi:hypothetical protein